MVIGASETNEAMAHQNAYLNVVVQRAQKRELLRTTVVLALVSPSPSD